jgi:hypothetical protein
MCEACSVIPYLTAELDLMLEDSSVFTPVTLMSTKPRQGMAMDIPTRAVT